MGKEVEITMPHEEVKPNCRRCGRKLKSPKSMERGFGDVCYRKHLASMAKQPLFESSGQRKPEPCE